ncbi:MAG: hypothetical protein ACYTGV_16585 [Planctomycetota bacterium]|jgi:hypothetical protein
MTTLEEAMQRIQELEANYDLMLDALKTLWLDLDNNGEVLGTDDKRVAMLADVIATVEGIDPDDVQAHIHSEL